MVQHKQSSNLSDLDRFDLVKIRRDIPVRYLPTIRADITVVWLADSQRLLFIENNARLHILLRNDRCSIIFYSNINNCIKYLKRARSREYGIIQVLRYQL